METTKKTEVQVFSEEFAKEIDFLKSYDQSEGYDITNLFRIMKKQIGDTLERLELLKVDMNDIAYENLWQMGTILKIVGDKVTDELFLNIDNLVYALENNEYLNPNSNNNLTSKMEGANK